MVKLIRISFFNTGHDKIFTLVFIRVANDNYDLLEV